VNETSCITRAEEEGKAVIRLPYARDPGEEGVLKEGWCEGPLIRGGSFQGFRVATSKARTKETARNSKDVDSAVRSQERVSLERGRTGRGRGSRPGSVKRG